METSTTCNPVWSLQDYAGSANLEGVTCIVCFASPSDPETDANPDYWHKCRTCTAAWCDICMKHMFETARDHEDEDARELSCPQCRGSISNMQKQVRLDRFAGETGCSEETGDALVSLENLVTETVNLCVCCPDGYPCYTVAPLVASRIMSRDAICDIVRAKVGTSADGSLRRRLRSGDFAGSMQLAMEGYLNVLRAEAGVKSLLPFLKPVMGCLTYMPLRLRGETGNHDLQLPEAERAARIVMGLVEAATVADMAAKSEADAARRSKRPRDRDERPGASGETSGKRSQGSRKSSRGARG